MNRAWITLAFLMALGATGMSAQTIETRIFAEPEGAYFYVDGSLYRGSAVFDWPKGSRHTVWADSVQGSGGTTRLAFQNWTDDKGLLQVNANYITVTADPEFRWLKATFNEEHRVDVLFYNTAGTDTPGLPGAPLPCQGVITDETTGVPGIFTGPGPGALLVNGQCVASSYSFWAAAGTEIRLNAFPSRGFVFEGWMVNGGPPPDSFLRTYMVEGPSVISPRFAPAKRVIVRTEPPGLNVTVDGAVIPTTNPVNNLPFLSPPWELDFGEGSTHLFGAPASQYDLTGQLWVLDTFVIDGSPKGGEGFAYHATNVNHSETIVARFVRGVSVSILTQPLGLPVQVDGRGNWPSLDFLWGVGTKHMLVAPPEYTDRTGRVFRFASWSNGGNATQEITVPEEGLRLIANFTSVPRITITSQAGEAEVDVDGVPCALPCVLDRPAGTTAMIAAPADRILRNDTRLVFGGWNDGGPATRTETFLGDKTIQAQFRVSYRLLASSDPAGSAIIRLSPVSADGFYAAGTSIGVAAEIRDGYRFRRWTGGLSGGSLTGTVIMDRPKSIVAEMYRAPKISSAGVRNAAGETPVAGVAPGSIISIFGSSLALDYVAGSTSPLAQTLGEVSVHSGSRILPLLFVSPEQVNAYLPMGMPLGEQTLTLQNAFLPEVTATFTVVPRAPGVFGQQVEDKFHATAQRPDGSVVSAENPAVRGEKLVLMGTGFGAYERPVIDGFPVPATPPNPVATKAEIVSGDKRYDVEFAGAAPGMSGVTLVRFVVPEEWPEGLATMRIRQGDVESNSFVLPVK